jgi:hypothetical protein
MKRFVRFTSFVCIGALVFGLWSVIQAMLTAPSSARAVPPSASPALAYPPGQHIVPFGAGQPDALSRREAYKALWQAIYDRLPLAWTAISTTAGANAYPPGTVVGQLPDEGDFTAITAAGPFSPAQSYAFQPARIAVFDSAVRDQYSQTVVWERGDFENLFRVYLWCPVKPDGSCAYFDVLTETAIRAGALSNYDVLIVPSIRTGWAVTVAQSLSATGLSAIKAFWQNGGSLYAQSDGAYLAEAAGLVPVGTVDPATRVTAGAGNNTGALAVARPDHPATFSWLGNSMYVLEEPLLSAGAGITTVAAYASGSAPGSPAILASDGAKQPENAGRIVLVSGHPSDRQSNYPQVFSALLWMMTRRAGLDGEIRQLYNLAVQTDLVPAYSMASAAVTTTFRNLWNGPLQNLLVTDTVDARFAVTGVHPSPRRIITSAEGTTIVWAFTQTAPGLTTLGYTVWAYTSTLASGAAHVSSAYATYRDPAEPRLNPTGAITPVAQLYRVARNDLALNAKMAARLNGDRDIELDGLYPLPAEGYYFDIAGTLENKEETDAHHVIVTDVVALLSPIVDVDDQTRMARVLTDVEHSGAQPGDTIWAANQIFFYDTPVPIYPLPTIDGVTATTGVTYGLAGANTVYTYTGHFTSTPGFSNSVWIPEAYSDAIRLTPAGVVMPALKLVYQLGDYPAYDYEDPAWRYGLFSQELFKRQVSHESDPMYDQGLIATGGGGTVFTNLGGHPIPYHEYLSSGIVSIPVGDEMSRASYTDIWSRPFTMELRTVSYDIVPFPPPEYHAVVNTTFGMYADLRNTGQRDQFVRTYPANTNTPADLHLLVKSYSNFADGLNLRKDETLISQGMFKGLGYELDPANGTWQDSWSFRDLQGKGPTATELITVVDAPAYNFLYFQQELDAHRYEAIDITATLNTISDVHKEGAFKTNDGARFVYHQKAVGPSRYEVFDSHVQAVFGLSADPQVTKKVAPVRVATFEDTVYHVIEISDPYDPRIIGYEPQLQSYGFDDLAATVYVGGRHAGQLLFPRVQPGGRTQIRMEVNNNSGVTLTNFAITPVAYAGITVTARPTVETEAIEPLFFDFPFLHRTTVPDAWKTVWYFDVLVDPAFAGPRGLVYPISFTVSANGLNQRVAAGTFEVPPARLGIEDANGRVYDTYGQAVNLELSDQLPPWMALLDARIADAGEMDALVDELALGHDMTATQVYSALRGGITTAVVTSTSGSAVSFELPPAASQLPWQDGARRDGKLFVILRSRASIADSGTAIANYGPALSFTDPFSRVYTVTGNLQTVEAHGARLVGSYAVNEIVVSGELTNGLAPGVPNVVSVTVRVDNLGDYIARATQITLALGTGVGLEGALPAPVFTDSQTATLDLGDLAPGQRISAQLVLTVTPRLNMQSAAMAQPRMPWPFPPGPQWTLIQLTDGRFVNEFVVADNATRQVAVSQRVANALLLGRSYVLFRAYFPAVAVRAPQALALHIGDAIRARAVTRQGEVFYATSVRVPASLPSGGHFYLSTQPYTLTPVLVDDGLFVLLNGNEVFRRDFSAGHAYPTAAVIELPRATVEQWAGRIIAVEYRDIYAQYVYASNMWLIWMP